MPKHLTVLKWSSYTLIAAVLYAIWSCTDAPLIGQIILSAMTVGTAAFIAYLASDEF